MRRILLLVASLALVAAACSSANVADAPSDTAPSASDGAQQDQPDGPLAPDFTLALQPTGEFVLSQEVKPVYMVFWAEW